MRLVVGGGMIANGKPPHWPKMIGPDPTEDTGQGAVRALAAVRMLVIEYLMATEPDDWRLRHARSSSIVDVIGGLIADTKAANSMFLADHRTLQPLRDEIKRLEEALAESKRPFSAQMEMQNKRIIGLTAELDRFRIKEHLESAGRSKPK